MKHFPKNLSLRLSVFIIALMCLLFLYSFFLQSIAHAADDYIPLAPLPGTVTSGGAATLETYLPGIFKLAIGIAGVLAVIEIIVGGLQYMSTDAIGGKSEGRSRITSAIGGLLLALGAYIILNTISPNFVSLNINIEQVNVTGATAPPPPGPPKCLDIPDTGPKWCGDPVPTPKVCLPKPTLGCQFFREYDNQRECFSNMGLCQ